MAELKVYFFRHGTTDRNEQGRLAGMTNCLVSKNGWDNLYYLTTEFEYPKVEKVYSSPAIRCRETASVLFPGQDPQIVENFWEMDFGDFEDKHMSEVNSGSDFDKWLRQDPDLGFPNGESILEGRFRALAAMTRVIKDCVDHNLTEVAVVAHGEILSLLMSVALITDEPEEAFMLCPNGMGYAAVLDTEDWFWKEQKMTFTGFLPEGAQRPRMEDSPFFQKDEEDNGKNV